MYLFNISFQDDAEFVAEEPVANVAADVVQEGNVEEAIDQLDGGHDAKTGSAEMFDLLTRFVVGLLALYH